MFLDKKENDNLPFRWNKSPKYAKPSKISRAGPCVMFSIYSWIIEAILSLHWSFARRSPGV